MHAGPSRVFERRSGSLCASFNNDLYHHSVLAGGSESTLINLLWRLVLRCRRQRRKRRRRVLRGFFLLPLQFNLPLNLRLALILKNPKQDKPNRYP